MRLFFHNIYTRIRARFRRVGSGYAIRKAICERCERERLVEINK